MTVEEKVNRLVRARQVAWSFLLGLEEGMRLCGSAGAGLSTAQYGAVKTAKKRIAEIDLAVQSLDEAVGQIQRLLEDV